jgi:hypothetical protein
MADRHTIENWGARLNIPGEELTMEQAMLLNLGHQNARSELMLTALQDMQMRLQRLEMYLEDDDRLPGYAEHAERMRRQQEKRSAPALAGQNGASRA